MRRQPRQPGKGPLDKKDLLQIGNTGVLIAAIALGVALYYYHANGPQNDTWQTMLFSTIGFAQVFQAFALRSSAHSRFQLLSNPLMLVVFHLAALLQLAVIYLPFLGNLFGLVPLPLTDLLVSAAAGSLVFLVLMLERKFLRK
jgi:Ca2+-transporting ATPase